MGTFQLTPGAGPPREIPPTPTPAPDPGTFLDRLLKPLLDWWRSADFDGWLRDKAVLVAGALLGAFIKATNAIALFWVQTFDQAEVEAADRREATARAAIKALFDVEVPVGRGRGPAASRAIGAAILRAVMGSTAATTSGGLRPSKEAAEQYMGIAAKLVIDGWMEGFAMEMASLGSLETFADLDDNLAAMLGIGRMSQQVAAPALDITVVTPFTWLLNKTYRPRLLSARQINRMVSKGRLTRAQASEDLARQGYSDAAIEALTAGEQNRLGVGQLDYLLSRDAIDESIALDQLIEAGWDRAWARTILAMEKDQAADPFRRRMCETGLQAYVARDIDRAQFQRILQTSGIARRDQQMYDLLGGLQRELRSRELSESDLEAAVRIGLRNLQDYRAALLKAGYSLRDVQLKELLLLAEIKDRREGEAARRRAAEERAAAAAERQAEQQRRREEAAARAAARDLSLAQVESLVRAGVRSLDEYRAFVMDQGFDAAEADDLAELLALDMARRDEAEQRRAELARQAAIRRVSLGDVEQAVRRGILTVEDYDLFLEAQNFAERDRALLIRLIQDELRERAEAEAARDAAREQLRRRDVSLADLELAVRRGLRTPAQYRERLLTEGFVADAADVMVRLVEGDVAADEEARKRRLAAEATAKRRKLDLGELARAVRAGVRPMTDYRGAIAELGFSPADQDTLERLLRLEIEADADAARRRAAAEKRLAERRIAIADVENAVKLGLLTPAQYRAVLAREGFPDDDQAVLSQILVTEIAQTRAAQAEREAARRQAPQRTLTLGQFEAAVRRGVRSMAEYEAFLFTEGLDARSVATLVTLLSLELAARRAAEAREREADATAAARGISLADFRQAVRVGLRNLQDYRSFLAAQRYGAEDVALLVGLLGQQLVPPEGAAAREAVVDAELATRGISLSDFRAAVRAGIKDLADYSAFLQEQRYGADDVATLVALLRVQLETQPAPRA